MIDERYQRGIGERFQEQLASGILQPILERLQHDDTLSLEIRRDYVDIYYRGGRLLGLHQQARGEKFAAKFDGRYLGGHDGYTSAKPDHEPPPTVASNHDADAWVQAFGFYKQAMDIRFCKHPKLEREYQQAVVRDNNRHATGDLSDYFVVDIEYAQSPSLCPQRETGFRFDMVGLRWPSAGRTRSSSAATPVIIEMKAGDAAIASGRGPDGSGHVLPGLAKHVYDIERFLAPEASGAVSEPYESLCRELQDIFDTKRRLRLPGIPKRIATREVEVSGGRPEVVFVIANHHPDSSVLRRELADLPDRVHADYYVANVAHAGYALYAKSMIPLEEFATSVGA
ncbi:MAG: hypothetical protein FDZ70_05675 [Actinobacteria bacterium]|nr:MAG: hypothetical protein FDZ70_05675 [Actinomycetota bacterium]